MQFLSADDAYIYIWVNRALLGGTILCLGINNYLMAHKAVFESKAAIIRFSSISLLTGIIASLLAYFALEMIIKIKTPNKIYLLRFLIIINILR